MPKFASTLPLMTDVFKDSPNAKVTQDLIASSRKRATLIIQELLPAMVLRLSKLIETETDPSSAFSPDRVTEASFSQPRLYAFDDPRVRELDTCDLRSPDAAGANVADAGFKAAKQTDDDGDGADDEEGEADGPDPNGDGASGVNESGGKAKGAAAPASKGGVKWYEVLPENKVIKAMTDVTTHEFEELRLMMMDLRLWLTLEVPVIEGGNSFGADIQGEIYKELVGASERTNAWSRFRYTTHNDRLVIAQRWAKFPNLQDWPAVLAASDRSDHHLIRAHIRQALRECGGLLIKLERNWSKVIDPKGQNEGGPGMY